jgi:GT2 family glycosyltransferase
LIAQMHDLAVIIVSTNEAHWLERCLPTVFAHAGDLSLDVVVVDNDSKDHTRRLVEDLFPGARVVTCANHGFGHGNNRGLMTCDARWVLFLNPDTEVIDGTFADLVRRVDAMPEVGIAGVQQLTPELEVFPTMRRFPHAARTLAEALGSERWPLGLSRLGHRELDLRRYAREFDLDWTSGSFMLTRREALEASGWFDERLFIYAEEVDLARRMRKAGYVVRHLPQMRIVHHANKMGFSPRGYAQSAFSARLYAAKHMSPTHRLAQRLALGFRYSSRLIAYRWLHRGDAQAVEAMRRARVTLAGGEAPYEPPPQTAVRGRRRPRVVSGRQRAA